MCTFFAFSCKFNWFLQVFKSNFLWRPRNWRRNQKIKQEMICSTKIFFIWTKNIYKFSNVLLVKTRRKQWWNTKKEFLFCFFRFAWALPHMSSTKFREYLHDILIRMFKMSGTKCWKFRSRIQSKTQQPQKRFHQEVQYTILTYMRNLYLQNTLIKQIWTN